MKTLTPYYFPTLKCLLYYCYLIYRHSDEQSLPKLMEVDKSTQGTLEEQMFYNRKTLQEITNMGHDDTKSQVRIHSSY